MYIYLESPYISIDEMERDIAEPTRTWQIKDARANFSTLVDKAISDGPQIDHDAVRRVPCSCRPSTR
jgi:hypothetical protein